MKFKFFLALTLFCSTLISSVFAQPTSTYWTYCTTDVLDTGMGRVDVYDYFTVLKGKGRASSFDTDVGLNVGLFSLGDFKLEVGTDYVGGISNAFNFNSKFGIDEDKLFAYSPGFSLGILNIGTKHSSNQDVGVLVTGKSLPEPIGGRLFVGGFVGKKNLGKNRGGVMVALDRGFINAKDKDGTDFNKLVFAADYASGKNTLGGGGFGLYYYFTPTIAFLTGPVWFNDQKLNGQWKWSVQLYFGERLFPARAMSF